jgi:acetyl-CoA synthetase
MDYEEIVKKIDEITPQPNMRDYTEQSKSFNWGAVESELDFISDGKLNMAYECIDRHLQTPLKDKLAFIWEGLNGEVEKYTFNELALATNKFANVLKKYGVKKGDRVFVFMERIPELYIALFGILKIGAIMGPLFPAFGPEAVKDRLEDSGAKILVTSPKLKKKVNAIFSELPELERIILVNKKELEIEYEDTDVSYEKEMEAASDEFEIEKTSRDDFCVMHYTSGTTGKPKGVVHAHQAIIGQYATAKYVLDIQKDDIYWCTADPGWVTGTSYGMFGPWTNGVTQIFYEGGFNADKWYQIIQDYKVTVWYTAPTAIRMLMKAGDELPKEYNLSTLRYACSVGEPLNPEAVVWGDKYIGRPFHDNWWQTETGSIMIANYNALNIKPGSMGRPFPGIEAEILDENYNPLPPGNEGFLAVKPGWPSMFRTYWNKEDLYNSCFKNGWYISGDKASKDDEGYFWFVGRADDVINTAGHLVGPFEVESVLIQHPAVAEAGVIGKPDDIAMEVVKAFVSLKKGFTQSEQLRKEIQVFVKKKLASWAYPREIDFLDSLPKTRSGKVMRRLLKARELGLPEGDTSTLEE